MTLRDELRNVDPHLANGIVEAYLEKCFLTDLSDEDIITLETERAYPLLDMITVAVESKLQNLRIHDMDDECLENIVEGVALGIGIIVEIAEVVSMPELDPSQ